MVFASMQAQRLSLRARALIKVSLACNEHFAKILPSLKTEHASSCKSMGARANEHPLQNVASNSSTSLILRTLGNFEGPFMTLGSSTRLDYMHYANCKTFVFIYYLSRKIAIASQNSRLLSLANPYNNKANIW